jgi:hypothetical protein
MMKMNHREAKTLMPRGWNTWNTRSVLSHVLLPEGLALNLGIKEYSYGAFLKEALIGQKDFAECEEIRPGIRSYDGSYTSLKLSWRGVELEIESAGDSGDLVILVSPMKNPVKTATLVVETGILWNRRGGIERKGDHILAKFATGKVAIFAEGNSVRETNLSCQSPFLSFSLDRAIVVSTGRRIAFPEARKIIRKAKDAELKRRKTFAKFADIYDAVQTCLAWDTIYDPSKDRVISPVSRIWSVRNGGYVLFCWDTFFAAVLASIDNRELAYANVIEILGEATKDGFVPNTSAANGFKTLDRSQPPVGSICCMEIFRRHGEKDFLWEVFEPLLKWNRWWPKNRDTDGLLCWGSNFYEPVTDNEWETAEKGVHGRFGAALESGLDNSPMYDDIPFDKKRNQLCLQDAGLTGLYIADCDALAEIAQILGRSKEAVELRQRAGFYRRNCRKLWSEKDGIFLNRRTDTGRFSGRISPTNFYPMLGKVPTQPQAERMMAEHFRNPAKFAGEWILPSISRDDKAYENQEYWRGRIWAPMNYLVYLGMRNYDLPEDRKTLAEKSRKLLLKEWLEKGHVHENYCADSGEGCNRKSSDRFYHWGALLGLIAISEPN